MPIGTPSVGTVLEDTTATINSLLAYPPVIHPGDALVACMVSSSASGNVFTRPTGWSQVDQFASTGSTVQPSIGVWTKVADGSETGTLQINHGSNTCSGLIAAFPGVDPRQLEDVTHTTVDQTSNTNSSILPGVTVLTPGAAAIAVGSYQSTTATGSPPAGFTEIGDRTQVNARTWECSYLLGLPNGATGNVTIGWSSSAGRSIGILLVLRPLLVFPTNADALTGRRRGRRR